jgi:hypothetical protein
MLFVCVCIYFPGSGLFSFIIDFLSHRSAAIEVVERAEGIRDVLGDQTGPDRELNLERGTPFLLTERNFFISAGIALMKMRKFSEGVKVFRNIINESECGSSMILLMRIDKLSNFVCSPLIARRLVGCARLPRQVLLRHGGPGQSLGGYQRSAMLQRARPLRSSGSQPVLLSD